MPGKVRHAAVHDLEFSAEPTRGKGLLVIIVQADNPRDIKAEELEPLVAEIRNRVADESVRVHVKDVRSGVHAVTLYEMLTVWIPTGMAYVSFADLLVRWARDRFRSSPKRPKAATIRSLDGAPLTSFVVRSPDGEVEYRPVDKERIQLPPPHDTPS
jgi:hypothetical protein